MIIGRVFNKALREVYRIFHPRLWGKRLQINGVPKITSINNLHLGYDVSINNGVYIQAAGGYTLVTG